MAAPLSPKQIVEQAEKSLEAARKNGTPPDVVAMMEQSLATTKHRQAQQDHDDEVSFRGSVRSALSGWARYVTGRKGRHKQIFDAYDNGVHQGIANGGRENKWAGLALNFTSAPLLIFSKAARATFWSRDKLQERDAKKRVVESFAQSGIRPETTGLTASQITKGLGSG